MAKKVYIIHGWDGFPEEGWFPWLKEELEKRGFEVQVPQMPDSDEPRIEAWVPALQDLVKSPDGETFFVGHSMGCQAIARYLERLPEGIKVGGAVFVAGFFESLSNLEDDDVVRDVADEWLAEPLDLKAVKSHLGGSVAIFSDDDPYVPIENQDGFKNGLDSKIIVEHGKGHFSGSTGTTELPVVLESLIEISAM